MMPMPKPIAFPSTGIQYAESSILDTNTYYSMFAPFCQCPSVQSELDKPAGTHILGAEHYSPIGRRVPSGRGARAFLEMFPLVLVKKQLGGFVTALPVNHH